MSDLVNNKQLVRAFFEALGRYDLDTMSALVTPDVTFNVPNSSSFPDSLSLEELSLASTMLAALCPDGIEFTILDLTAEDDRVAARVEGRGTMAGGEYFNQYHFLFKIRDGKICETFEYLDSLLLQNLFGPMLEVR